MPQTNCPDCGTEMQPVKLFGKGPGGHEDVAVRFYTAGHATRGWTGRFPAEGRLTARMCSSCGRIALYGGPDE